MFGKRRTGQVQDDARMIALEARVATLEKQFKEIDAEWSMWYDKFRRLLATISKRAQRAQEGQTDQPEGGREPEINPFAKRLLGSGG